MLLFDTAIHLTITWYLDTVLPGEFGVPQPYNFFLTVSLVFSSGSTSSSREAIGFYPPTSGTAVVNGYDITSELGGVWESLGVCPQHDVLFDTLTVQEHLVLFAKRRRLSVGIALIYYSKVVILDEPTTGVDPSARRQLWDLLDRHREGRTIMLSTHFMDEADALGDRIAIMADGKLMCCGTPMFLKKRYGIGYHLVIVKATDCKVSKVTRVIRKAVPGATFQKEIQTELFYLMPDKQVSRFVALFKDLEARKEELGILSFGASGTTMEDVFLRFV
nr:hypothetical protein BaRGS_014344 [Batillaria attramentaria]